MSDAPELRFSRCFFLFCWGFFPTPSFPFLLLTWQGRHPTGQHSAASKRDLWVCSTWVQHPSPTIQPGRAGCSLYALDHVILLESPKLRVLARYLPRQ